MLGILLGLGIIVTLGGTIFVGATLASISASLPNPNELVNRESAMSTKIYDRGGPENGTLLYTIYGDQNREFVSIDKVPEHTRWAFLAAEDVEFYDHKGLDLPGLAKAAIGYVFQGASVPGASTISQQLVRNTLLYDFLGDEAYDKTLTRKAKEILITMQLEQNFTKDEILQMYLNEVPLGGTNYGIQAAAEAYFAKNASELTLAESTLLAGLVQQPGTYSPLFGSNPEMAVDRQGYVLNQMDQKRSIINRTAERIGNEFRVSDEILEEAESQELLYATARIDIEAPHFVFFVKQKLIEEFGIDRVERGGLIVTTSLDYDLQSIAEEELRAGVDRFRGAYNVNNGSMVVIDPRTGQILAMVGSYDYFAEPDPRVDGNVNIATSLRQMGSSVKPYTYLTAFHQGYSPSLLTPDIPMSFGDYKAKNWDNKYSGLMLARQALVESRNLPALYTVDLVGVDNFIQTAETLGITSLTDRSRYGLSITLGAAEMQLVEHTGAFATFANGGVRNPTTSIMKVETHTGDVLTEWSSENAKRVWDEKEMYLLNWALCDLDGQGRIYPQYYQASNQKLCGKTGTTDGPRDLTAFLYYPNLAVGVWTGNNNNDVTIGSSGQGWSTTVPLPIANSFMSRVIGKFGTAWYSRPAGIVSGSVCRDTGLLAQNDTACDKVGSVFIQGKLPPVDDVHVKKPICKETGKIATNEAEANELGLIDYKTFFSIKLPEGKHQSDLDKWLSESEAYGSISVLPETAECPLHLGPENAPTISFSSPPNGADFDAGDTVKIEVAVSALGGVKKVEYRLDNVLIGSSTTSPYALTYAIPNSTSNGDHTLSAIVTDTTDRTGNASITITVNSNASSTTLTMIDPENGEAFSMTSFPITLIAEAGGNTSAITNVYFIVEGQPGPISSKREGNRWIGSWNPLRPTNGNYTVYAVGDTSNDDITSGKITIRLNN